MTFIPFSSHFPSAQFPLQLLHMDLVGPITPSSISGFNYFLTIIDQYSSFKFVWFLKAKSGAFEEFARFANLVENLQGCSIKEVVSDQGGEFVNKVLDEYTSKKGILQTFSPAETPKLNGFAERANRTILDKARCLLLTSSLPKS
jgi:transposase InsO family protein